MRVIEVRPQPGRPPRPAPAHARLEVADGEGRALRKGRQLVEAAKKYHRVVQMGSQSRSDPYWINQVAAVRSGKYGRLLISYGYASKPRRSIAFKPPMEPPTVRVPLPS